MSCSMSILVRGLPSRRRSRNVHFRATRSRCQRNRVAGDERIDVAKHPGAYLLSKRCQSVALCVTEQNSPSSESRSKQTIFGFQIFDLCDSFSL